MAGEATYLHLAHWRRTMAELYAQVRSTPGPEGPAMVQRFRRERDRLFSEHPQSPLTVDQRQEFTGLYHFPYAAGWRTVGQVEPLPKAGTLQVQIPEGVMTYTRIARIHFTAADTAAALSLYWIGSYGGGLFLPFKDATNDTETYGGGRYLYDTIKGADLGAGEREIVLDFNYAYNPSCAYNSLWHCPLPPRENALPFRVVAGEKRYPFSQLDTTSTLQSQRNHVST